MSLAEALQQEQRSRRRVCKLGQVLDGLEPSDRDAFDAAVAAGNLAPVHRALKRLGHSMAYTTVTRHVNGDCGCRG